MFSIEGCDGSGKTSVAGNIVEILNNMGYDAVYLREPTYQSPAGIEVRRYLDNHISIDENALMDLFINDRIWDTEHNIKPALEAEKIVIMDRYFISNAVYEHSATWPWQRIMERNRELFIQPDAVFILRPGVETCWTRLILRGQPISQYETKDELRRTQEIYDEIVKNDSGKYIVIDDNNKHAWQTALEIIDHIFECISTKEYWENDDEMVPSDDLELIE